MTMVPKNHLPIFECSECGIACVIRLSWNLSSGDMEYLYQRDCKHKRGEIMAREGETALSPFRSKAARKSRARPDRVNRRDVAMLGGDPSL